MSVSYFTPLLIATPHSSSCFLPFLQAIKLRDDICEYLLRQFDVDQERFKAVERERVAGVAARAAAAVDSGKCAVCIDAKADMVFVGCGHVAMCQACTQTPNFLGPNNKGKCTICRVVAAVLRVFIN